MNTFQQMFTGQKFLVGMKSGKKTIANTSEHNLKLSLSVSS